MINLNFVSGPFSTKSFGLVKDGSTWHVCYKCTLSWCSSCDSITSINSNVQVDSEGNEIFVKTMVTSPLIKSK